MSEISIQFERSSAAVNVDLALKSTFWQAHNPNEPFITRSGPIAEITQTPRLTWSKQNFLFDPTTLFPIKNIPAHYKCFFVPFREDTSFHVSYKGTSLSRLMAYSREENLTIYGSYVWSQSVIEIVSAATSAIAGIAGASSCITMGVGTIVESFTSIAELAAKSLTILSTEKARIEKLDSLFRIDERQNVYDYLQQNTFLIDLLFETHQQVKQFFGEEAYVKLELLTDPESTNGTKLFAVILTSLSSDEAIRLQEKLNDEWWLDNLERAKCLFNIDVEYI